MSYASSEIRPDSGGYCEYCNRRYKAVNAGHKKLDVLHHRWSDWPGEDLFRSSPTLPHRSRGVTTCGCHTGTLPLPIPSSPHSFPQFDNMHHKTKIEPMMRREKKPLDRWVSWCASPVTPRAAAQSTPPKAPCPPAVILYICLQLLFLLQPVLLEPHWGLQVSKMILATALLFT